MFKKENPFPLYVFWNVFYLSRQRVSYYPSLVSILSDTFLVVRYSILVKLMYNKYLLLLYVGCHWICYNYSVFHRCDWGWHDVGIKLTLSSLLKYENLVDPNHYYMYLVSSQNLRIGDLQSYNIISSFLKIVVAPLLNVTYCRYFEPFGILFVTWAMNFKKGNKSFA